MKKKRNRKSPYNPLVQFGAPKDTVKVLANLNARLEQALTLGREESAKEIAREIGKLGGVTGVTVMNSTFNG